METKFCLLAFFILLYLSEDKEYTKTVASNLKEMKPSEIFQQSSQTLFKSKFCTVVFVQFEEIQQSGTVSLLYNQDYLFRQLNSNTLNFPIRHHFLCSIIFHSDSVNYSDLIPSTVNNYFFRVFPGEVSFRAFHIFFMKSSSSTTISKLFFKRFRFAIKLNSKMSSKFLFLSPVVNWKGRKLRFSSYNGKNDHFMFKLTGKWKSSFSPLIYYTAIYMNASVNWIERREAAVRGKNGLGQYDGHVTALIEGKNHICDTRDPTSLPYHYSLFIHLVQFLSPTMYSLSSQVRQD